MPQRIICAGLNRSGSTLAYNATRLILERAHGKEHVYTCFVDDYEPSKTEQFHVIKAHSAESVAALDADTLITSYRDIRAVAGSFIRMGWVQSRASHIDATLDNYIKNLCYLREHADLCLRYEEFARNHRNIIKPLIELLHILPDNRIAELVERDLIELKPVRENPSGDLRTAEPRSMLHAGHIGAVDNERAIQLLDDDMRTHIEQRYAFWLLTNNYAVPMSSILGRLKELDFLTSDGFGAPPIIPFDEDIPCNSNAPAGLLKYGFAVEEWGSWSQGEIAQLEFRTPPNFIQGMLAMVVGALTPSSSPPIVTNVFLDGEAIDTWYWRGVLDHQTYDVPITTSGTHTFTFVIKGARTPSSIGIGDDCRRLGMAFARIRLTADA